LLRNNIDRRGFLPPSLSAIQDEVARVIRVTKTAVRIFFPFSRTKNELLSPLREAEEPRPLVFRSYSRRRGDSELHALLHNSR